MKQRLSWTATVSGLGPLNLIAGPPLDGSMGLLDKAKGSESSEHHELHTPSAVENLDEKIDKTEKSSSLLATTKALDSKVNSATIAGGVVLLVSVAINAFLLGGYQPIPFIGWISLALVFLIEMILS